MDLLGPNFTDNGVASLDTLLQNWAAVQVGLAWVVS